MRLITQIKQKQIKHPGRDVLAGIIIALVSIPISVGYAQIAGLPAVYGLYSSFLPILVYAFLTTSPQFVVGVDAMPAVMVGTLLATEGIASESTEALNLVPVISLLVAGWFIVFYLMKAGRIVKYISTPVMGGFISGVGITIILMQIPKMFGGKAGTGELPVLLMNIWKELPQFNGLSFFLGITTFAIVIASKKYIPKVPMTAVMMMVGALVQLIFHVDRYGVLLLPEVEKGLPKFLLPNLGLITTDLTVILLESLSIAAVIMAQTLLATGSYASKYGDNVENNKEILAYCGMNLASAFIGGCPINGSVSRSKIADNSGARSQLMSISAGLTMLMIVCLFTPLLKLLPIPILTAIVMTALFGIVDVGLLKRLWKENRGECLIFLASMMAVLFLGTVNGVIVGCVLSFWEVSVRAVNPPVSFLGRIPGHGNFHSLERNSHARPIKNTVIYRFSGNLFFANIDKFEQDIEKAIKEETKQVVVDARGIGSIDITAIDRLLSFSHKLKAKGIKFYFTEHASSLNDSIRQMGGEKLLDEGVIRITISIALRDAGVMKPYELEGAEEPFLEEYVESEEKLAEFEWAFGAAAEEKLRMLAEQTAKGIVDEMTAGHGEHIPVLEEHGATTTWGMLGLFDEYEFWDFLEARITRLRDDGMISEKETVRIIERIDRRKKEGIKRLDELNPLALDILHKHMDKVMRHIEKDNPVLYKYMKKCEEEPLAEEGKKSKRGLAK